MAPIFTLGSSKSPVVRSRSQQTRTREVLRAIRDNVRENAGMLAMRERKQEFSSELASYFAGIAVYPAARERFNQELDEMWNDGVPYEGKGNAAPTEVVIGAGLHAAIYCSVRVAKGFPRPLVIEASERVGGVFHVSENPAFYLNSRNRPGDLSIPGRSDGALNVIPGGPVQPSDLSGDEYQRNSDLAFSIRAALAMNAKVITKRKVESIEYIAQEGEYVLSLSDGTQVNTNRVVIATGLSEGSRLGEPKNGTTIVSFLDFMTRMDTMFPLRDMNRIAVVGAGDSGRTVIEALTGQGPSTGWSVAALDFPNNIDWYGVGNGQTNRAAWEECNRSRYKGIARVLPRKNREESRVTPLVEKAGPVSWGFDVAYVNERPYDLLIDCTGFKRDLTLLAASEGLVDFKVGGRVVAKKETAEDIYVAGVVAGIPITDQETTSIPAISQLAENATSLFRYAGRTAALASELPGALKEPPKRSKKKGKQKKDLVSTGLTDENGVTLYIGDRVEVRGSGTTPMEPPRYFVGNILGLDSRNKGTGYLVVSGRSGSGKTEKEEAGWFVSAKRVAKL